VWDYFEKMEAEDGVDAPVVCKLCRRGGIKMIVKRCQSSTRDMLKHMWKHHSIDTVDLTTPEIGKVLPYMP
jgi:hypothetical protein